MRAVLNLSSQWLATVGLRARLLPDRVRTFGYWVPRDRKSCAIVRVDALGDFVLWLPFARRLIDHQSARGLKVTLICNAACAPLANLELPGVAVVPVNPGRFRDDIGYRRDIVRQVGRLRSVEAYHPTYSRDVWVGDSLVRACGARRSVGFDGDMANRSPAEKHVGDGWYTQLVRPSPSPVHEWRRNAEFLAGIGLTPPDRIEAAVFQHLLRRPKGDPPYFVVVPGAGWTGRQWPESRFASVARRILELRPGLRCVIAGAPAEAALGRRLAVLIGDAANDLTGRTGVVEYVELIASARFVLCNESSAAHISAAAGVPCVVVAGGGHFGRFVPYAPLDESPMLVPATVFHAMSCFNCNWGCKFPMAPSGCAQCLDNVSDESVWRRVVALL